MPCVFRLYKSLKNSGVEKRFKTPFLCRFSGRSGSPDAACRNVRTLWQFLLPEQPNPMRFVCENVSFVDFFCENVVWGLNFYLLRIV